MQIYLEAKRTNIKTQIKSKNKFDKNDSEIQNQLNFIEKENEKIINLHNHKLELIKECSYLIDFHLNKTNEIIKNYEKVVQTNLLNGNLLDEIPDKNIQLLDESNVHTASSKI